MYNPYNKKRKNSQELEEGDSKNQKLLHYILKRTAEEKLLKKMKEEVFITRRKQNNNQKQLQEEKLENQKQIREIYSSMIEPTELSDSELQNLLIYDQTKGKQIFQDKINEFLSDKQPVKYFRREFDQEGAEHIVPEIDVSHPSQKFRILALNLFKKKTLIEDLLENHLEQNHKMPEKIIKNKKNNQFKFQYPQYKPRERSNTLPFHDGVNSVINTATQNSQYRDGSDKPRPLHDFQSSYQPKTTTHDSNQYQNQNKSSINQILRRRENALINKNSSNIVDNNQSFELSQKQKQQINPEQQQYNFNKRNSYVQNSREENSIILPAINTTFQEKGHSKSFMDSTQKDSPLKNVLKKTQNSQLSTKQNTYFITPNNEYISNNVSQIKESHRDRDQHIRSVQAAGDLIMDSPQNRNKNSQQSQEYQDESDPQHILLLGSKNSITINSSNPDNTTKNINLQTSNITHQTQNTQISSNLSANKTNVNNTLLLNQIIPPKRRGLSLLDGNLNSQIITSTTSNNSKEKKISMTGIERQLARRGGVHQIFQIHLDRHDNSLYKYFINICNFQKESYSSLKGRLASSNKSELQSSEQQQLLQNQQNILSSDPNNSSQQNLHSSQQYQQQGQQITKNAFYKLLTLRYDEKSVQKILNYLEPPFNMDFRAYRIFIENINSWHHQDILFFCFYLLDRDNDGLLDQSDIFQYMFSSSIKMLEEDAIQILHYLEEETNNFETNLDHFMNVKPLFIDFYTDEEPKTHKTFVKKSRNVEITLDTLTKKDTMYHICMQRLEHDFNTRERREKFEAVQEQEKQKSFNIPERERLLEEKKQEIIVRMNQHFSSTKKFHINFQHFKEIFSRDKPLFFYDFIAFLTLFQFRHIKYPYTSTVFLTQFKEYERQMKDKLKNNNKNPLEEVFPYTYREKSQLVQEMVGVVQRYKSQGKVVLQQLLKKEQERILSEALEKQRLKMSYQPKKQQKRKNEDNFTHYQSQQQ